MSEEVKAMEAKFAKEMEEMEANEKWEKSMALIPEEVRPLYVELLNSYSTFLKIKVYKFLDLMAWQLDACRDLHRILTVAKSCIASTSLDRIDWYFDKLALYEEAGYMQLFFTFFRKLENKVLEEFFLSLSDKDLAKVVELVRFLPSIYNASCNETLRP
jgi:hypothetical protein